MKKRLGNFNRAGEGGEEGGSAASIAIAEIWLRELSLPSEVNNRAVAVHLANPHKKIPSWEDFFMLNRSTKTENAVSGLGNRSTNPAEFTFSGVKVPNFIQIARHRTISIFIRSSILPWVSCGHTMSDFSAILLRCFNLFSRGL